MIRFLVGFLLAVLVIGVGGIAIAYGEVDPCRVLAVEQARRAKAILPLPAVEGALESWARLNTSQMSTGACVSSLMDSWGERAANASGEQAD